MSAALALLTSKLGLAGIAAAAAAIVILLWRTRIRRQARAEAVAEMKAATAAESGRRQEVLERAQAEAQRSASALGDMEKRNAAILQEIALESASHDGERGLDAAAVDRLRRIGRD